MPVPLVVYGIMAAGTALNIMGQRKANKAEAKARRAQAAAYEAQRYAAEIAAKREAAIFEDESAQYMGTTVSEMARSGVVIEGSALLALAKDKASIAQEHQAIRFQAAERSKQFTMAAAQESATARRLSSSSYNNMQTASTLLNVGGDLLMATNAKAKP